jgi:hypothetical protein
MLNEDIKKNSQDFKYPIGLFCARTENCLDKLSSELFFHVASRELCVHGTDVVLEAEHDGQ